MSSALQRSRAFLAAIPRAELYIVAAAMAVSIGLVVVYVLATRPNVLAGDQSEYHEMGILFTQGKPWWGVLPFGEAHASAYRPPVYPAWVGVWYELLGANATRVAFVQSLLAATTVGLSWALARRLFGSIPAVATASIVALCPAIWEWFGLLYTEALAIPLVAATLVLFLDRPPTPRLAAGLGALMGVGLLVRPTSVFLFAGIAAAFVLAAGWRRGGLLTVACVGVAALVIAPWTIRNYVVSDGFVPLSVQDAAIAGSFNPISANDPDYPYAWQPYPPAVVDILDGPTLSDAEYRSQLIDLGTDYIADHPASLLEAFYWNGLSRFWDVRRPSRALDEVEFEGRSKALTSVGLAMHYVLLPLALVGLWRHRRRRSLVVPVVVLGLAASLVFTVASGTRYRAPLEPLIITMAVAAFVRPRGSAVRQTVTLP